MSSLEGLGCTTTTLDPWRNRITGHADVGAGPARPEPRNWRTHPAEQQRALTGALGEVGWVAQVLVNTTTGHVVDGHLRVELALERNEPTVPVTYVELSEDEERLVLATLDPLAAMADAEATHSRSCSLASSPATTPPGAARRDRASTGIDALRTGLADPDEIPDVPAEPLGQARRAVRPGRSPPPVRRRDGPGDVARLLDGAQPRLLATDPPYGVSLDPTWRDGVYNELGPAEKPYMRVDGQADGMTRRTPVGRHGRTEGHRNTTLSGDTRVDWWEAFELVRPSRSATSGTPGSMPPRWQPDSSGSASRSCPR